MAPTRAVPGWLQFSLARFEQEPVRGQDRGVFQPEHEFEFLPQVGRGHETLGGLAESLGGHEHLHSHVFVPQFGFVNRPEASLAQLRSHGVLQMQVLDNRQRVVRQ